MHATAERGEGDVGYSPLDESRQETAFEVPSEHIVRSSNGKDWNGVDIAEIVHPQDDFALPAIARHVLVINLGAPTQAQEHLAGRQGRLGTGSLTILPAHAPSRWHLDHRGDIRHLHLYLPPSLVHKVAAEADIYPDRVELVDAIGVSDPQIETIISSFLAELRSDGLGGRLFTESLTNLLVIHLLRHHSSIKQPSPTRTMGLGGAALKRVQSYIEDHLAEELSLAELAAQVHLSPYHFARRFKEATGFSPHQYVIRRRIERAKLLLTTTTWPLSHIAHIVGFASESHFALHFKQLTGLTPRQYHA
jgi:AraC family transcriptional regulator